MPRVVWCHTFETPFHDCAIAAGIGEYESLRGLAVLMGQPEDWWIHYTTFEADEKPPEFRQVGLSGSPVLGVLPRWRWTARGAARCLS